MKSEEKSNKDFLADLKKIIGTAQAYSYRAANQMQIVSNWLVGWRLVEQEQHGKERADYGKFVIETASKALTEEFGKGYSVTTLKSYRKFYVEFQCISIQQYLPVELKRHFLKLGRHCLPNWLMSKNSRQCLLN